MDEDDDDPVLCYRSSEKGHLFGGVLFRMKGAAPESEKQQAKYADTSFTWPASELCQPIIPHPFSGISAITCITPVLYLS